MVKRLKSFWELIKTAVLAWFDDRAQRLGAALSFYTVLAIPPLFVIVFFIASLWMNANTARTEIFGQINSLIGEQGSKAMQTLLTNPQQQATGKLASIIAIGTLLITATGVFLELQDALNMIWGVEQKPGQGIWGFVKNRLLSFAVILSLGFLLLVSLVVSAGLSALNKYFTGMESGDGTLWQIINTVVSFGVIMLLFAVIFKLLPDVKIAWKDVWIGAGTTAALFTGGKYLLGLYLGQSSVVSAYGAAGSVILVFLWVYYSAQILYFGAEITQVYASRIGSRIEPSAHAQWIEGIADRKNPERKHKSSAGKPAHARKHSVSRA